MTDSLSPLRKPFPKWTAPMLATLTYDYFSDPNWIFECKLDGMRCLFFKKGKTINIFSRNKILQNDVFPELVVALSKIPGDFILDGEVVAFKNKISSFEKLQARMHVEAPNKALIKKVPVYAYIFDLLYYHGYTMCHLPLLARKEILIKNFKFVDPIRHLEYKIEHGEKFLKQACRAGWEGIIAKNINSRYEHKRSRNWLKFKCSKGQELVIGGFTKPQGKRMHLGALLLGYYENGKLKYAGRVGTGFNEELLTILHEKLEPLIHMQSPFVDFDAKTNNIIWVKPRLVAELRFMEWTADGHLRHPSFIGLRNDKDPKKVTRD